MRPDCKKKGLRFFFILAFSLYLFVNSIFASAPSWWSHPSNGIFMEEYSGSEDHYAPVNVGQLKHVYNQSLQYLVSKGVDITELNSFTSLQSDNYKAVNIGQLKALATLVYDKLNLITEYDLKNDLISKGIPVNLWYDDAPYYPWDPSIRGENYKLVNLGQLKAVFSFEIIGLKTSKVSYYSLISQSLLEVPESCKSESVHFTIGFFKDTDSDGISDNDEENILYANGFSKKNNIDSDGDHYPDGYEVAINQDPTVFISSDCIAESALIAVYLDGSFDSDGDGLTDQEELTLGLEIENVDSDQDGFEDGLEVIAETDPLNFFDYPRSNCQGESSIFVVRSILDEDSDGLTDLTEENKLFANGKSSKENIDSDGDFYYDGFEVSRGTDPTSFTPSVCRSNSEPFVIILADGDYDEDGMMDSWEMEHFGNISRDGTEDYDKDGLWDLNEFLGRTNPLVLESNQDEIPDVLNLLKETWMPLMDSRSMVFYDFKASKNGSMDFYSNNHLNLFGFFNGSPFESFMDYSGSASIIGNKHKKVFSASGLHFIGIALKGPFGEGSSRGDEVDALTSFIMKKLYQSYDLDRDQDPLKEIYLCNTDWKFHLLNNDNLRVLMNNKLNPINSLSDVSDEKWMLFGLCFDSSSSCENLKFYYGNRAKGIKLVKKATLDPRPNRSRSMKRLLQKNLMSELFDRRALIGRTKTGSVGEDLAFSYYKKNLEQQPPPSFLKMEHIVVSGKNHSQANRKAIKILKSPLIDKKGGFQKLVKKHTSSKNVKVLFENLGYLPIDQNSSTKPIKNWKLPLIEKGVSLEVGEVYEELIKTKEGFHIVKLTGRKTAKIPIFDQVKQKLIRKLLLKSYEKRYPSCFDKPDDEYLIFDRLHFLF
tara:strand:+ start:3734 stop:6367 length:2634 start_codon:yes stop_codon:yes gene_type:complete